MREKCVWQRETERERQREWWKQRPPMDEVGTTGVASFHYICCWPRVARGNGLQTKWNPARNRHSTQLRELRRLNFPKADRPLLPPGQWAHLCRCWRKRSAVHCRALWMSDGGLLTSNTSRCYWSTVTKSIRKLIHSSVFDLQGQTQSASQEEHV